MPERQAAFRVGNVVEEWPDMAAGLAARRFDLDDVGAEVAEQLAAELALFVGQFQDRKPGQWTARRSLEHVFHVRKARPLGGPERAVIEAGAQFIVA